MAAKSSRSFHKLLIRPLFNSCSPRCLSIFSQTPSIFNLNGKPSLGRYLATLTTPRRSSSSKTCTFASKSVEFLENRSLRESILGFLPWSVQNAGFHSLGDQRLPKRRPSMRSRRKRASMKPPGPYVWVKYVPGEPIPRSRPNEGSVRGRNHRKRMEQRAAFRSSQAQIRKDQLAAARRKKRVKRIERKMAAVARERAWAERLAQLQQAESEAGKTPA